MSAYRNNAITYFAVPGQDYQNGAKELLDSGLFTDLTITCKGKTFNVHKLVLYTQSSYFRALLGGRFKESNASTIDLDDDPIVVEAMLYYLYNFTCAWSDEMAHPVEAVALYQLGDKYDIPPLRLLAVNRLQQALQPLADVKGFIEVIYAIESHTNPNDPTLLNVVIPMVKKNLLALLEVQEFVDLLSDLPEVNIRLLTDFGASQQSQGVGFSQGQAHDPAVASQDGLATGTGSRRAPGTHCAECFNAHRMCIHRWYSVGAAGGYRGQGCVGGRTLG